MEGSTCVRPAEPPPSKPRTPKPGARQGRWTTTYESGARRSEGGYLDGEMHGPFSLYYENGILREQGQYVRGRAHGKWTKWDENGNVIREVFFAHGVKVEPPSRPGRA